MASLKDMRVRIASTKATQKITKAMQMVAASMLRRAQNAAAAALQGQNIVRERLRNALELLGSPSARELGEWKRLAIGAEPAA